MQSVIHTVAVPEYKRLRSVVAILVSGVRSSRRRWRQSKSWPGKKEKRSVAEISFPYGVELKVRPITLGVSCVKCTLGAAVY